MYSGADTLAGGFPHSEIRGSTIARISPQLIAACHVLHRLLAPRHPPNALIALIKPPPPARRTKPHETSSSSTQMPNYLYYSHSTTGSAPDHRQLAPAVSRGLPRDQPFRFTCQTTRHPQAGLPASEQPSVVQCAPANPREPSKAPPKASQIHGDGRYRTDGPLLAKQVLYH